MLLSELFMFCTLKIKLYFFINDQGANYPLSLCNLNILVAVGSHSASPRTISNFGASYLVKGNSRSVPNIQHVETYSKHENNATFTPKRLGPRFDLYSDRANSTVNRSNNVVCVSLC